MGKRHKHRLGGQPPQNLTGAAQSTWRERVESLLAAGQTREAVEAAKQLLKLAPGPEAESLLLLAYEARIRALMASGMYNEARSLASLVSDRFRAHRNRLAPLVRESELLADGGLHKLLAELSSAEPPRRRELEALLARELTDPAVIADSSALAADDPLKLGARTVCDLFAAVTSGPLPTGALAPLDVIPRHSPLAPWKLLIRALDAFYRRADAVALANLSAIAIPSGPSRLVPILRRLLGEAGPTEDRSVAVTNLLNKVSGGRTLLRSHLPRLNRALAAQEERTALTAVEDILFALQASPATLRQTFIVTVLYHWFRRDLDPRGLMRALRRHAKDLSTERLMAVAMERAGVWDAAVYLWDQFLTTVIQSGVWPAASREVSRALLHMAELFPADYEEAWDPRDGEFDEDLPFGTGTGTLPDWLNPGHLLERAQAADPDPRVFRALIAYYEQREPKRAEAGAEAWRKTHPRDLEPLLYLVRAAEGRGAFRKALGLLAEAEAINGVHPEVRRSGFRLLLASAERRLRERKLAPALADLDRLEREPRAAEGDHMAYLLALRWVAAKRAADMEAAAKAEELLHARVGNPVGANLILRGAAHSTGLEPPRPLGGSPPSQAIEGLARACDLFRELKRPLPVPTELVTMVERDLGSASIAQLYSLAAGGLRIGYPSLSYAASGGGLAQDGPLLHRFLLARGQAVKAGIGRGGLKRARRCLRAARELAARARDIEAVREASVALQRVPTFDSWMAGLPSTHEDPPTQEEIRRIIAAEREDRKAREPADETAPRRTRPRPGWRRPNMLQALLPLWEESQ